MVYRHKKISDTVHLKHRLIGLLDSAKPGHTEPSDWSAAKKTDASY